MSIQDYETPTAYGALDSTAFAAGEFYSAHLLRVLGMSSNHLCLKGQHLGTWLWPTHNTAENAPSPMAVIAYPFWVPFTPPLFLPKRKLLNRAKVKIRAFTGVSGTTETVQIQVATLAMPFNANATASSENVVELTEDGDYVNVTLSDLPISEGLSERVQFFVRGVPSDTKGDTSTYGSPNAAQFDSIVEHVVSDTSATWNTSGGGGSNWSDGGHYVVFEDSGGTPVVTPRRIRLVTADGEGIVFDPALTPAELSAASAGGYYTIYRYVRLNVAGISIAADPRTI